MINQASDFMLGLGLSVDEEDNVQNKDKKDANGKELKEGQQIRHVIERIPLEKEEEGNE